MEFVSMDLIGEFHPPSSKGNRYALTAVCMLTGYTFCIPIKSKSAEEIAVMKPLWYLGFILVLERFSMFIFQDLRVFQQLEFNYVVWLEPFGSSPSKG